MNAIDKPIFTIRPMSQDSIDKVIRAEEKMLEQPQVVIGTLHILHGGMYARSITIPKGNAISGALIKIPTMITVSGDVTVYNDGMEQRIVGYHIIPASCNRKQVFIAHEDTDLTMVFPTKANTVEEAEMEFTDEYAKLGSRKAGLDIVIITGEKP